MVLYFTKWLADHLKMEEENVILLFQPCNQGWCDTDEVAKIMKNRDCYRTLNDLLKYESSKYEDVKMVNANWLNMGFNWSNNYFKIDREIIQRLSDEWRQIVENAHYRIEFSSFDLDEHFNIISKKKSLKKINKKNSFIIKETE